MRISISTKAREIKTTQDILSFVDAMFVKIADNRTIVGGIKDPKLISNLTYANAWISLHIYFGQDTQKQLFVSTWLMWC